MQKQRSRRILVVLAIALALIVLAGLFLLIARVEKEQLRDEFLQTLDAAIGEYDEQSIVLSGTSASKAEELAAKYSAKLRISFDGKYAALTLPEGTTIRDIVADDNNLSDLSQLSIDYHVAVSDLEVLDDEPTSSGRLPLAPRYTVTDTMYSSQSYLDYLNLSNVWNYTKGAGVTVAVIDTGIDTDHPEFAGRISEYSYNASEDKIVKDYGYDWSLIEDEQGHGTSVAGVIGAAMDGSGIVGIAPDVTLLVIKCDCNPDGSFKRGSDLVFGLYYAIERDVDVVNMSFGGTGDFSAPAQLAVDSDIICVAAAGNDATAALQQPACLPTVIGVGALADGSWELAEYSNFGDNSDIVAPGTTYTAAMGGGYKVANGTSLACPNAVGVIALYLSQHRYAEFKDVQEVLYASCYDLGDLGEDFYFGFGAIDASALLLEEKGTITFDYLTDEIEATTQVFVRHHMLQNIPEPERDYAVFDGWYYDIYCTEEYNWYEDKFVGDLTLYAGWANEEDGVPYTYVELDDGTIEIRSYTGHRRYITIPDKIEGKTVSSIGEEAFMNQTRLRQVNLPRYLKRIRRAAFANCTALVSMEIPDTVTEIGESAFSMNVRLSSLVFGTNSGLQMIGDYAFEGCGSIRSFMIPKCVHTMNGSAFFGTTGMLSFDVQSGNSHFKAENGILYDISGETLVAYPAGVAGEYTILARVKTIGDCAFGYAKITGINLQNVSVIGDSAFSGSMLKTLVLPDGVKEIGKKSFANCAYLESVKLGHGLTTIPAEAFQADIVLSSVEISSTIQTIGIKAFKNNIRLSSLTFEAGSTLTVIEGAAFYNHALVSVAFPDSLREIGVEAFANGSSLSSVTFGAGSNLVSIGSSAFVNSCALHTIQFPSKLQRIGDYAFAGCGLTGEIVIPASVNALCAGAFASCHALTDLTVASGNTVYLDEGGVVFTKDRKTLVEYPAGKALTYYTVPEGIDTVFDSAFYGSWNLDSIGLPESLVYIQRYAFYDVKLLSAVSIPDNVMQISNRAFAEDWNLHWVYFGENAKLPRLSYQAFAYTGLYSFRVPASVSTMAQGAFEGCKELTSFTFAQNSKLESISAYMFDGCSNLQSITFESGSALTSIQAHGLEGMARLTTLDFGDAKLTNIDNFAFRFCESLQTVNMPETLTNIGRYAFYGCKNLTELRIPENVEHIGRFAFLGAKQLDLYFASETLPAILDEDWDYGIRGYYTGVVSVREVSGYKVATLTDGSTAIIDYMGSDTVIDLSAMDFGAPISIIGGGAFKDTAITSIVLPNTITAIQAEAFAYTKLGSITVPANVTFIGRSAFYNVPIKTLTFAGEKILTIEKEAFASTKQLSSVVIPKSVKTLGRAVFKESGISSLTFAAGTTLTEIPEEAFAYTKLTSVTIPDSVTRIHDNAFREVTTLKTVTFGSGADIRIDSNVFYHCGLTSLHIPANIGYIGEYAFVGLRDLQSLDVASGNPYYKSVDGVLYSKDGRKLIVMPAGRTGVFTVPVSVETIGFGAFEDSKLSAVNFPSDINLLTLGYRAFYNADNITELHIPASVISIDYYAFAMCDGLTTVTFAEDNHLTGVYEGAFYGDVNLSNIELPDTIIEISDFAFYGCKKIDHVPVSGTSEILGIYDYAMAYTGIKGEFTTPETLIDIGNYAFKGIKITKLTVPATNYWDLMIGLGAFESCNKLEEVTLPFIGASFEDTDISWFGYIFGAGAYEANNTYVPASLKEVTITEGITEVGMYAFYGCENLKEIHVPHSVTVVSYGAFAGTTAIYSLTNEISFARDGVILTSIARIDYKGVTTSNFGQGLTGKIVLSKGITNIDVCSFMKCSSLTSIMLPDGVTSIGDSAFSYCSGLTKLTIPSGVTSIGGGAFFNCSGLTELTIPDGVTSISGDAFWGCTRLTSITIPDSVTSIGSDAFSACSGLTSITIPDSVTSIGSGAFSGCSGLTSITIPDSVTSIGSGAFSRCSGLTSITIPDSVTSIGDDAFSYCSGLTSITIPDSVTSIGEEAFLECSSLTSITIPSSVTSIGESAFYWCRSLTSITFSENSQLTSIGGSAFRFCTGLMSIMIPSSVTSIGRDVFYGCSRLYLINNQSDLLLGFENEGGGCIAVNARVIVDKNGNKIYQYSSGDVPYIDTPDGFRFILRYGELYSLIAYLGSEETVTLPRKINGFDYEIYHFATGARHVIIPDGVRIIGVEAFDSCTSLTSITIPNSVTRIGSGAFRYCTGLTELTIPDGVTSIDGGAFSGCSGLTELTIPSSVTSIGSDAFSGCTGLTSITISKYITTIFPDAFEGCQNLSIQIDEDNPYFMEIDGVVYNKEGTEIQFVLPERTGHITLSEKITTIPGAFSGQTKITGITIPDGVTSIGFWVFTDCTGLTSITIPDSVTSIGESAFSGCTGLTSITIPDSVTSIGGSAFSGCTGLTSITIPDSVTSIGESAFSGCTGLTSITIPDSVTSIGNSAFSGCSGITSITIPDSVTNIGDGAFGGCTGLTSITIPDSVTSIGGYAFYWCEDLTSITIPDSVTSIGESAFSGCTGLTSITIPDSVTSIGESAFHGCTGLRSITIPDSVTSIGGYAFSGCTGLTNITISKNISYIASSAFTDCSKLDIVIADDNPYFMNIDGVIYNKEGTEIQFVLPERTGHITLSEKITTIPDRAFSGQTKITGITIPFGVTSIDIRAFSGCTGLTSVTIPNSVRNIGESAFSGCTGLTSITIPDSVTSIGWYAFDGCTGLTSITIPSSVTSIGNYAFSGCNHLYLVNNQSNIQLAFGSQDNGRVAYYAKILVDKNGNKTYRDSAYVETPDGFLFALENGYYTLIAYLGSEETVTLPRNINGNDYKINDFATGACNVIIPDGETNISNYAFYRSTGLTSIKIPDSVTSIGEKAFNWFDSGSAYFKNPQNWSNGALFIDGHLIAVDETAKSVFALKAIAQDAFEKAYSLKILEMQGNHSHFLSGSTNLETLILDQFPSEHTLVEYFGYDPSNVPMTLKNIVLRKGITMPENWQDLFYALSGVTIYVEDEEKDLRWDENFPGWNNGNKVIYGGHWIATEFYDENGELLSYEPRKTSQIIRQPVCDVEETDEYLYDFLGWDIDGDGKEDLIPATSAVNIKATPMFHKYTKTVIAPTCTEDGYTEYVCEHCGDRYMVKQGNKISHTPAAPVRENEVPATTSAEGGCDEVVYCSVCHTELSRTHQIIPKIEGKLSLSTPAISTAWGCTFTVDVTATQTAGEGGEFTLTVDPLGATIIKAVAASKKASVTVSGNTITVKVTGKVTSGEKLVVLTLKASNELPVGATNYLSISDEVNKASFKPLTIYEMGDVNMDGKINSRDAVMIQQYAVKMITLTPEQLVYADVFCDGKINSRDAVLIQQFAVKMPVELGDRVIVEFKSGTSTVATRTVRKGTALTTVPTAPEGKRWSASQNIFATPVYSNITASKKFYLLAD